MKSNRVLIVDDSSVFRSQIRLAFEGLDGFIVTGSASNGRAGLEKLAEDGVELVTLDLEMPEMSGLEMLAEMSRRGPMPKVIVFSALSQEGADITLSALRLGATDFVLKPKMGLGEGERIEPSKVIQNALLPKLRALFDIPERKLSVVPTQSNRVDWNALNPQIVVIGSSTGGPKALEQIFSGIKGPIRCPIVIVQHMPPMFTASLVARLGDLSGIQAGEARDGEPLLDNRIYIAPGDYHLTLIEELSGIKFKLDQNELINFVRPAVDPLFQTAAKIFKDRCLAVVLTGMGSDGKLGALDIKGANGAVVIQSQESCTVFGMPGAIFEAGCYDRIGNLDQITLSLAEKLAA